MRPHIFCALLLLGSAWSGTADATSEIERPSLDKWTSWGGTWVRLENGHLSCLSDDGKNCFWGGTVKDPASVKGPKPLVCGAQHSAVWGGKNGYNDYDSGTHKLQGTRHWCRSAYAQLAAEWVDYSVLGVKLWLAETPDGDLMCHSTDGKTCTPVVAGQSPSRQVATHPVVCGAHHRRMLQIEGYETPGHWCQTPRMMARLKDQLAIPGKDSYLITEPWTAEDEPAVVVRAQLPAGRRIELATNVELASGERRGIGGAFGAGVGMWVSPKLWWLTPEASWRPLGGRQTFGFKVTAGQHLCLFRTEGDTASAFFNTDNVLLHSGDVPWLQIKASLPRNPNAYKPESKDNEQVVRNSPHLLWQPDKNWSSEDRLEDIVLVVARHVPFEGGLTSAKRKISYAEGCDRKTVP